MDEELLKRNTDCVYFLASPLTCKKGIDCEYRHSEIARLNPRDCWYWLSGNCVNPTCAFRHPPLDGHDGAPFEPAQSSASVNKTSVPCYFYFNGFCNKGDKCPFSHGHDDNAPAGKPSKTAALLLENKASAGNETRPAPTEIHINPSESGPRVATTLNFQPMEDLQQPVPKSVLQRSTSPQIAISEDDETAVFRSESLLPAGFIQSRSPLCTDQSSEDQVDDHIEPEERWESSPGFDVLVGDKSEDLDYEDDPDYLLALNREHRELNGLFLGYDFEDPVECDPTYPDAELYEHKIYDGFGHLDNDLFGNVRRVTAHSRDKMLDSLLSQKRKFVPVELAVGDHNDVDLRDHLRRRRVVDGRPITGLSRRHRSSRPIGRSQERRRRHDMGRRLHGRLASEVVMNTVESHGENGTLSNGANYQRGFLRRSQQYRSRKHFRDKKFNEQEFPTEVYRKQVTRERRSTQESSLFTGPKTLAQIKEEKKKVEENGDIGKVGHSSRTTSADFQGPKPLRQILKDKRKLDSVEEW